MLSKERKESVFKRLRTRVENLIMKFILLNILDKNHSPKKRRGQHQSRPWEEIVKIIGVFLFVFLILNPIAYPQELNNKAPYADTIVYELNYNTDGTLCSREPVISNRTVYAETGKKRTLSRLEQKYASGLLSRQLGNDEYEIRLMAYKQLPLYLKKSETDHRYKIYIKDEGQDYLLKRVFIRMDEHSSWFPAIRYIDLIPVHATEGNEILQRINI